MQSLSERKEQRIAKEQVSKFQDSLGENIEISVKKDRFPVASFLHLILGSGVIWGIGLYSHFYGLPYSREILIGATAFWMLSGLFVNLKK